MKAQEHPSYNDGLRSAAQRAWDSRHQTTSTKGYFPPEYAVWFDGEAIYVRDIKAVRPKNGSLVCIAQFFSGRTVQLRFTGAHSEWVNF